MVVFEKISENLKKNLWEILKIVEKFSVNFKQIYQNLLKLF